MTSSVDQAWADMKSPKVEKYASRVNQVLSGSVATKGRRTKALGSSASVFNRVRATCHVEPTAGGGAQERIVVAGTKGSIC